MGSVHPIDPDSGPALPELPPISTRELAVGLVDLFSKADGLILPHFVAVHESTQHFSLQFAPVAASLKAVPCWAQRFGAVLVSGKRLDADDQECTYVCADFDFFGVQVHAYAYIPVTETGT
jgi:hypothetical protein